MSDPANNSASGSSTSEPIASGSSVSGQAQNSAATRQQHFRVAGKMLLLAVSMFGFGYLMVPMYDIICDITGLNGKTGRISAAEAETTIAAPESREITVEFVASINQGGRWIFRPTEKQMKAVPGELYQTSYYAENLSDHPVVAQATPSVTPFSAAKYFNKTECFCFTRQEFAAKDSKDMPLTFMIDPDIPVNVDRITLSYTFFRSPDQS